MAESKKTKMIVVVFLLIILTVSVLVMIKLYKAQSVQMGTVKISY